MKVAKISTYKTAVYANSNASKINPTPKKIIHQKKLYQKHLPTTKRSNQKKLLIKRYFRKSKQTEIERDQFAKSIQ